MSVLETHDAAGTRELGKRFGKRLVPGDVVALSGSLGAGKTVFVQGVAQALGITEPVTSPSFTLISEYRGTMKLYHMDLYRLGAKEEFVWLGVEEMLNGSGVSLIEWGERAKDELPERTIHVTIRIAEDGHRLVTITDPEQSGL